MSQTLAVVKDVIGIMGVNFYGNCRRFRVKIITRHDESTANFVKSNFPDVTMINPIYRTLFPRLIPWTHIVGLERYLHDVDLVNTIETYFFISCQCAKICYRTKKKLVTSVFETIPNHVYNFIPIYAHNTRQVLRNTNLFIALSNRAKRYLKSISVSEDKIRVIYYGVDTTMFAPHKKKQHSIPRILFVARLSQWKGLPDLLKAFSILHKDGIKAELWICGSGELTTLVKSYSRKYPIRHLGFIDYKELPTIYDQCDIFCLPDKDWKVLGIKIWEPQFENVLVEAMSSGLPIITTNCGAIPEIVGPKNIISQGSVKEVFSALKGLVLDERKRKEIGKTNRERALNMFDAKKQSKKFENALMELF